jgi:four helix bundle protein
MSASPIRDYRDLLAWQVAIKLAEACGVVADQLPRREWQLASQIRRAANSVHAGIAEGNGAFTTTDYLRHLGISNKSLREVESHLYFVARRYRGITGVQQALQWSTREGKLLTGLVKSLRAKRDREA